MHIPQNETGSDTSQTVENNTRMIAACNSANLLEDIRDDMVIRGKEPSVDAVGMLPPWIMAGTQDLVLTACGAAFIDFDTRVSAADLEMDIDARPAGKPELRARIERMFGTMSTRIREINANAMARRGLLVDDYSQERIAKLEDGLLIGFEVNETPREAQALPATDGLDLVFQASQSHTMHSPVVAETPAEADIARSFGKK